MGLRLAAAPTALLLAACSAAGIENTGDAATAHTTRVVETRVELGMQRESWVSEWENAPFGFDELLPSWNVSRPRAAAFRVDLELGFEGEVSTSGWLDLGGRGNWPARVRSKTEFAHGAVEVDLVKLTRSATRVRWRFRAESSTEPVIIERLVLCFTRAKAITAQIARSPRPAAIEFNLRLRRQYDESPSLGPRICSPTSVAMVLEQFGTNVATETVAALLFDTEHDIYGNWNHAVQGAFELGVPGYLTRIADWPEAAAHLAQGSPLIISIGVEPGQLRGAPYASTAGHLVVLAGFDSSGRAKVYDPAVRAPGSEPRWYDLRELEVVWLARGGFAYLLGS